VWKKQIGYAQDEIGDDIDEWKSRIHPDDLQAVLDQTRQCIDGETMRYQTEFRFRHNDGSYRWILSQGSVLYDESGQPVRMVGSHMDITKREQLIGELREALAKVKTLSGMLPICAKCKKIRDGGGYWNQIESYLERHTDADFTHGYCPDCMDEMYGEKEWYKKGKRKNKC
jgi:PAS domain S-box-containing protein